MRTNARFALRSRDEGRRGAWSPYRNSSCPERKLMHGRRPRPCSEKSSAFTDEDGPGGGGLPHQRALGIASLRSWCTPRQDRPERSWIDRSFRNGASPATSKGWSRSYSNGAWKD
jgi:hypothetical protein